MFLTKVLILTGVLCAATIANAQGLSGEQCTAEDDVCIDGRTCYEVATSFTVPNSNCTSDSDTCYCFDPEAVCDSSDDCDDGERCFQESISGADLKFCLACDIPLDMFDDSSWEYVDENPMTCATPTVTPDVFPTTLSPSPVTSGGASGGDDDEEEEEEDEVCVSIDALSSYSQEELVYPSHRRAAVLCDKYDNCATPGHMVLYQQHPMMMKTYCEQTLGCSRRVKLVNSPRMKTALRIFSKSDHLQFLAFAAKLQSRTEEIILSGLVRLGM